MCCGTIASADVVGLGGFFLIGGVVLFFDRAMYASPPFPRSLNVEADAIFEGLQWAMYGVIPLFIRDTFLEPGSHFLLDSLPNRPNNNNRTPKNDALLRASAKTQRYGSFLLRPNSHLDALGTHRFLG